MFSWPFLFQRSLFVRTDVLSKIRDWRVQNKADFSYKSAEGFTCDEAECSNVSGFSCSLVGIFDGSATIPSVTMSEQAISLLFILQSKKALLMLVSLLLIPHNNCNKLSSRCLVRLMSVHFDVQELNRRTRNWVKYLDYHEQLVLY